MDATAFAQLPFSDAFNLWLSSRVRIAPGTRRDYLNDFHRMAPYFGPLPLSQITIEHVNNYRADRAERAGPGRINKELNCLQQIMTRAGVWAPIGLWYERLPQPPSSIGIALQPDEEAHLFRVASSRPRWIVAYCASLIARNTSACPGELRALTLENVDREKCTWIKVARGCKNAYRVRSLPCNPHAQWALRHLYARAQRQGAYLGTHYLLPGRGPDPSRPMIGWYKAWRSLRNEVAKKYPRLSRLRFYDCRHSAATGLLEDPSVSYPTIERILGHRLSSYTKELYSHVRDEAIRKAVNAIASGHHEMQFVSPSRWRVAHNSNASAA